MTRKKDKNRNKKEDKHGFDDLLKDIENTIGDVDKERNETKSAFEKSTIGQLTQKVTAIHKAFNQAAQAGMWVYNNIIDPVVSSKWAGWPFRAYGRLWNYVVHTKDDKGEPIFSKRRAGLMACMTLAALFNAQTILGGIGGTVWDAGWMATTTRTETWYLGHSQEIYPDAGIFSARGCEQIECDDQDTIYFRIKPSFAHNVRNIVQEGDFFYPDFIAAAIPNDTNKCEVTFYGTRMKGLIRSLELYPQILSVSCSPLTAKDVAGATPAAPTTGGQQIEAPAPGGS